MLTFLDFYLSNYLPYLFSYVPISLYDSQDKAKEHIPELDT